MDQTSLIAAFVVIIAGFLIIDLGILSRRAHAVSFKESLGWTGFWIAVATLFGLGIRYLWDRSWGPGLQRKND